VRIHCTIATPNAASYGCTLIRARFTKGFDSG
jgi:hypothetical protein